jgi:hypothetical protein
MAPSTAPYTIETVTSATTARPFAAARTWPRPRDGVACCVPTARAAPCVRWRPMLCVPVPSVVLCAARSGPVQTWVAWARPHARVCAHAHPYGLQCGERHAHHGIRRKLR